jgi:hypothetical protein
MMYIFYNWLTFIWLAISDDIVMDLAATHSPLSRITLLPKHDTDVDRGFPPKAKVYASSSTTDNTKNYEIKNAMSHCIQSL